MMHRFQVLLSFTTGATTSWSIYKSIYAPRRKRESDAKDFWDGPEVAAACCALDWAATMQKGKFHKFLGRGLHSSTFRLNVSTLCGIGGAFRGCLGGV